MFSLQNTALAPLPPPVSPSLRYSTLFTNLYFLSRYYFPFIPCVSRSLTIFLSLSLSTVWLSDCFLFSASLSPPSLAPLHLSPSSPCLWLLEAFSQLLIRIAWCKRTSPYPCTSSSISKSSEMTIHHTVHPGSDGTPQSLSRFRSVSSSLYHFGVFLLSLLTGTKVKNIRSIILGP